MSDIRAQITKLPKTDNQFRVVFPSLTKGELLALKHALQEYSFKSPVGRDVYDYLGDIP